MMLPQPEFKALAEDVENRLIAIMNEAIKNHEEFSSARPRVDTEPI